MNTLGKLIASFLCAAGIWQLTAEWRDINVKNINSVIRYFGSGKEKPGISDRLTASLTEYIRPRIRLSDGKRAELEFELASAHLQISPEYYIAQNISISLLVLLLGLAFGIAMWSGFFIVGTVGSVLAYRSLSDRVSKERKKVEETIDRCMPEFAAYICSYVKVDHNVLAMLSRYRARCSEPVLRDEIDITIADAGSSGIESALIRFDARAHSSQLSSIVRALITLANGTFRPEHFDQLESQFRQAEKDRLRKQAMDIPARLKPYNFAVYTAFVVMLMVMFFTLFIRFTSQLM